MLFYNNNENAKCSKRNFPKLCKNGTIEKGSEMEMKYNIKKDEILTTNDKEELIEILKRKDKSFELAQKIANVGYWEYDQLLDKVSWSKQMFVIHGIDNDLTVKLEEIFNFKHPDDRKRVFETFSLSDEAKTPYEIEYRIVRPNGEVRYVVESTEFFSNGALGTIQDITENKNLRLQLIEEQQYYKSLFENNPDAVFSFNLHGNFLSCNSALQDMFGYSKEELLNGNFEHLVEIGYLQKTQDHFMKTIRTRLPQNYETTGIHKNGEIIDLYITNIPIIINNELVGVYGIAKNITEKKAMEQSLLEAETKYRSIVEQSIVGVFIAQNEVFIYTNPQLNKMLGYNSLIGLDILENIHPEDRSAFYRQVLSLSVGQSLQNISHRAIKQDGTIIICEVHYTRILHQGKIATVGTVLDITDRRKTEELNHYLASHDYLTDLPNRRMFEDQLDKQLRMAQFYNKKLAVLLIDLDRFKIVNDTLGHSIGDALLKQFANKLNNCLGEGQTSYRLGGDEFCIVLTEVNNIYEIMSFSDKIIQITKEVFLIEDYELNVTISIGISMSPEDGDTVDSLLKNADTALYFAKSQGRDQAQCYSSSLNIQSFKIFTMSNDLRKALDKKELFLQYMPRVDAQTTQILGAEALIRWNHPDWGLVSPVEFIPIAEETGLIVPIGEWVLREACKQNKQWKDMGLPPIIVSVNFSVQQLLKKNILQTIDEIVDESGISPDRLEIEITESSFISNEKEVTQLLVELKKRKIKVSLDDFGTGYSSLYLLKRLALDAIKIDKSFVEEILTDPVNKSIIECILNLAKALQMNVVAEGVETAEQYAFLKEQKCNEIQGYYFSRPIDAEEFGYLLKNKQFVNQSLKTKQEKLIANRRRYFRVNLKNSMVAEMTISMFKGRNVELGGTEVYITNIGPGGLKFLMGVKLPVNDDIILKFRTEILNQAYELHGSIAWINEIEGGEVYEYGVQFQIEENERLELMKKINLLAIKIREGIPSQTQIFVGDPVSTIKEKKKKLQK
ncbi:EAL domain-containing protein [Paenibacillus frigoriresistens]|uniref:EAL domain-containing protein n=1 Tax=Paenibacillus alginolyticus TaxID=59839 RepID=UPI001566AD67|nr:EAL domain-containing protein [Paenibacillus frigoriresistens]NRF96063.1 EAL domain-containing protein [Paenibacillus frigoriresistens]